MRKKILSFAGEIISTVQKNYVIIIYYIFIGDDDMKNKIKKVLAKITAGMSFCLVLFCFISCENFMNGGDIKEQIKAEIAYNNAPECNVLFKADPKYGSFLTGETLIIKAGYEAEVKFKINKEDYVFVKLEAVKKSNPEESLADYVTFTNKESDEEKGIYTINVKITKQTSDLIIRPVCISYPSVVSYSPTSSEPQFANMPIVINFNMPMVNDDTGTAVEFSYDNIIVTTGEVPLKDYFETPVFNEDKTKLTLAPKANEFEAFINRMQADFIEVKISLKDNITVKSQNHTLALKHNDNSEFIIKYKGEVDETPPQRLDFFVTRHPISIDSAGNIQDSDKFLIEVFQTGNRKNFEKAEKNKCNGTIYIYGKYYDKIPGVSSVTVNDVVYNTENAEFFTDTTGNTTFCITHVLPQTDNNTVECFVSDSLGNNSTHISFTAFHKTLDASKLIVYNFEEDFFNNSVSNFDLDYYNQNRKTLKIAYSWNDSKGYEVNPFIMDNDKYQDYYGSDLDNITYYENFKFECEYTDKEGVIRHGTFSNDKDNLILYYTLENVEKLDGLKVKIIITDEVDNIAESEIVFPVQSALKTITKNDDNTAKIDFEPISIGQATSRMNPETFLCPGQIILYEENGIYKTIEFDSSAPDTFTLQPDIEYKVIPIHYDAMYPLIMLYGDISSDVYTTESSETTIPNVSLNGNPSYVQGDYKWYGGQVGGDQRYDYYMDITVKIAYDSWNIFDYIYASVDYWDTGVVAWCNTVYIFTKNEYEIKFSQLLDYMHAKDTKITVYGIKDNQRSSGTLFTIPKFTKTAEDDHNPPKVQFIKNAADRKYVIKFSDGTDESGPDYAYVTNIKENGDYKYKLDSSNSYTIEFPFWELTDASNIRYSTSERSNIVTLEVIGYDKNGNKCIGQTQLYIYSNDYYSYPATADANHIKDYDLMIPNGSSKKSIGISSNAPVMVHTLVTKTPYSECKDWSIQEWEHYKKTLGQKELQFSSTDYSPKRYTIPYDEIETEECYCVIAWFADKTCEQSEVWQK